MSPQFVDFNADGHVDIVTATYDGSPHVAYGSEKGFQAPVRLMDASGRRITLTVWYDWETNGYKNAPEQGPGHLTSALAFDWDGDGDMDLLLGDYNDGNLYRRMNDGTATEPRFSGKNEPVLMKDGKPLVVKGGLTSPRLVDWDRDGVIDLLCGSYGDSYGSDAGGAVVWYRNVGKSGQPEFAAPVTLIEPSKKGQQEPTRPDAGLFVDAADYDGDGDLDLIVGAYSMWNPPARELTAAQQERVTELRAAIADLDAKRNKILTDVQEAVASLSEEERREKMAELYSKPVQQIMKDRSPLQNELNALVPTGERKPFVWLYRNTSNQTARTN